MENFITNNFKETQKLGENLAQKIKTGAIICLQGELGSGKTTFTQGLLKGLGVEGPYTSPTFLIMKEYNLKFPISNFQFPINIQIETIKNKSLEFWN